ncbi:hypothetical protein NMG60_11023992 [Bertholletia excelsa]
MMGKSRIVSPFFLLILTMFVLYIGCQEAVGLKCCFDNKKGKCMPNSPDDEKCNKKCLENCEKGGRCKQYKYPPPNQFCHCFC